MSLVSIKKIDNLYKKENLENLGEDIQVIQVVMQLLKF